MNCSPKVRTDFVVQLSGSSSSRSGAFCCLCWFRLWWLPVHGSTRAWRPRPSGPVRSGHLPGQRPAAAPPRRIPWRAGWFGIAGLSAGTGEPLAPLALPATGGGASRSVLHKRLSCSRIRLRRLQGLIHIPAAKNPSPTSLSVVTRTAISMKAAPNQRSQRGFAKGVVE